MACIPTSAVKNAFPSPWLHPSPRLLAEAAPALLEDRVLGFNNNNIIPIMEILNGCLIHKWDGR